MNCALNVLANLYYRLMERIKSRSYKDLLVWQRGIELVNDVYTLTNDFPRKERYVLIDQIRRSAISVPSNIAEGQARQYIGEFTQFLHIALGSLAELDTQVIIATELGYLTNGNLKQLQVKIAELQKMIHSLISSLKTEN